jgi:hypothetical protein
MNSYISLILDAEGAKAGLRRLFQAGPESERNDLSLIKPFSVLWNQRQRQKREVRSRTAPAEVIGYCSKKGRSAAQCGSLTIEACVWIVSSVLVALGVVKAAYSAEPLLWLTIWPAPIVFTSTVIIFLRQGFHYRDGVFVLGRRRG